MRFLVYRHTFDDDDRVYFEEGYSEAAIWAMGGTGRPLYAVRVKPKRLSPDALRDIFRRLKDDRR